ncbi:HAD family hydrolase [Paenibacillus sp. P26]|nr:HAD family hydrolase [Paenibacillus sp. P26]
MKKLIFLDRDGVINRNVDDGYVLSTAQIEWLPGAMEGSRRLNRPDNRICIVTNQAAVGKGILPEPDLLHIHRFFLETIREEKGRIDEIYYCPHTPEERCPCRKPRPGLLQQGIAQFGGRGRLWMVGDSLDDMRAGKEAGRSTILVESPRTLRELRKEPKGRSLADYYVQSLLEAARIIEKST